jgi:pilus assembly protein CpaC
MMTRPAPFPDTNLAEGSVGPGGHPGRTAGWPGAGYRVLMGLLILLPCFWLGAVTAAPLQDQQTITVPINKSRILDLREPISRISIANPAIADILVIKPKQIYINAKVLGTTNMVLWDERDQVVRQIGLEVVQDLEAIKEKLYRLLPGERIRVESAQGVVVLSGTVSSPSRMDAALRVAQAFVGGGGGGAAAGAAGGAGGPSSSVINLMQVGGAQQVLLEVKVAEVNRTLGKSIDARFLGIYDGGSVKIGLAQNRESKDQGEIIDLDPFVKDIAGTGLAALINSGNFYANLFLEAAEDQGLARILAEPNLTTLSGQEAEFLSGGSFFIPSQGLGTAPPEEVKYGIQLKFVPFVMDSGLINLSVNVSVSEPGPPTLSGGELNTSIISRGANATVEVPSGQVIAIAGLLTERSRDTTSKFPGLGDIPVLGTLFRSQTLGKEQTELVIFVTPRLANSFNPQQVTLPTDGFVEPNDVEFYLMGKGSERRPPAGKAPGPQAAKGDRLGPDKKGSEGLFGHDL